ncbi:MAG: BRO family protein [Methanobacterium sp. ERen5]|nr:MAG: BRO family protein [Methanobacterium sp. ERen5]
MNEIMNIGFEHENIETVMLDGEPLFNPYHIGKCLDMTKSAVQNHLSKMNKNKRVVLKSQLKGVLPDLDIPHRGLVFLKKSGVYNLILKSRKPEAEKFQDWLTDEVLPQIEKTGSYQLQPQLTTTSKIELESSVKSLQTLGFAEPAEISNIHKQSWRAKLLTLINTLSHERQTSTKQLYEELYYQYAASTGIFIPHMASANKKSNGQYLKSNETLSMKLYQLALTYFYQGKSVVELFNFEPDQKMLSDW